MPPDPPLNPHPQAAMPPNPQPEPSATPPLTPPVDSSPLRRVLPGVLSAAAVLSLLLVMLLVVLPRLSQVPRPGRNSALPSPSAAALPPAAPAIPPLPAATPAQAPAAVQVPLSVTLYSTGSGKHVPVGSPVLISAYAALPPAGSATIAIACTRNGGPRSLLTLAQGSLSTISWTPAAPGRYDFSASASDSRKISVFSRHLFIDANAPPASAKPRPPVVSPAPPPAQAASAQAVRVKQTAPRHIDALRKQPVPVHQAARASASKTYHVAAATFVVRPIAETLAGALRRRGFRAFVRVTVHPHHKPTYAVETGDFSRSPDAQKQVETLKRDGYPASVSHGQ